MLNEELNEHVFKSDLLHCFLEVLVSKDHIVGVTVNEQNCLVLNLRMASSDARRFEVLLLSAVAQLQLHYPRLFLLPLSGYQFQDFFMILLIFGLVRRVFEEGRSLPIEHLQVREIFHDVSQEWYFFLGARVVLKGEFFEDGEFN